MTKPSAGTCGGKPGEPYCLKLDPFEGWHKANADTCISCPGCERCHPKDCIYCVNELGEAACEHESTFERAHAYHGPGCTDCGGTGRVWGRAERTFENELSDPCTNYRRPE